MTDRVLIHRFKLKRCWCGLWADYVIDGKPICKGCVEGGRHG